MREKEKGRGEWGGVWGGGALGVDGGEGGGGGGGVGKSPGSQNAMGHGCQIGAGTEPQNAQRALGPGPKGPIEKSRMNKAIRK